MEANEVKFCTQCSSPILPEAFFCFSCGIQVKCKNCQETIPKEANNCVACGTPVIAREPNHQVNTFKLRENKEERVYEIKFSNEVGKEIKEVIADLLKNKEIPSSNSVRILAPEEPNPPQALENANFKLTETRSTAGTNLESGSTQPISPQATYSQPEYPHLNDLEIVLNLKENEWLLIFAFYNSNFGVNTFTKDIVWQVYKDRRKTETRFKNLGTNWKALFKKYIATVKENEFRFTTMGLQKVKSLLSPDYSNDKTNTSGKKGSVNKTRSNSIRTIPVSRKVLANSIVPNEFDVYQNNYKQSLESFFREKNPGYGNPNRIITIAYYITKINHQEYFTEGNIDFAYRILNLGGRPAHLKQVIINLKNERIWFQKILDQSVNGWKLTRQGELYVEEKLPFVRA